MKTRVPFNIHPKPSSHRKLCMKMAFFYKRIIRIQVASYNEARPSERSDRGCFFAIWQKPAVFRHMAKKPLHCGLRTGFRYTFSLCAVCCLPAFFFSYFGLREVYMTDFHKPGVCRHGRARANAWDLFQFRPFRVARGRRVSVFGGFADAVCVLFFMRRDFDFF